MIPLMLRGEASGKSGCGLCKKQQQKEAQDPPKLAFFSGWIAWTGGGRIRMNYSMAFFSVPRT